MSSGGVFKLICNDGKPDRLLTATQLLNQRIKDVMCARSRASKDPTPTLQDIEKTHILHVNAHFKPFAAIGYEYNKVRAQSGVADLSGHGNVTFSIPQFGDFFHDMVARQTLSACWSSQQVAPAINGTATVNGVVSALPADGNNWDNAALLAGSTYALVDAFGNDVGVGAGAYRNMVRYCEYPGERLYQKVSFDVNGNPLDEYWSTTVNMLRKFTIGADKINAYKRLVGQEVPFEGHTGPRPATVRDNHYSDAAANIHDPTEPVHTPQAWTIAADGGNLASNQWDKQAASAVAAPAAAVGLLGQGNNTVGGLFQHVQRGLIQAVDGPQTPKYWQPSLEIWNSLWFWCCTDARLAVPSVSIPFGQRFIQVQLASQAQLIYEFPGIFVEQTITTAGAAGLPDTFVRAYRPYYSAGTISTVTMTSPELYINNIFVNPEIHDIYIRRVGFSLIRVFRRHVATKSQNGVDSELLSQLKWPIEYMFVGLQPAWNTNAANHNQHRDWHRFGKTLESVANLAMQAIAGIGGNAAQGSSSISQIVPDTYIIERPTVTDVSLTVHGIKIHDAFPQKFFNSYVPFHYGGAAIVAPEDAGVMMINFSLFPGCYQAAGYLNTSRAREMYLSWTSTYGGANTAMTLYVIAIAINFLLITDGSAVLRYST